MGVVAAIVVFIVGLTIIHWLSKKINLSFIDLSLYWVIKLVYTFCYVYVFSTYYGEGDRIQGDSLIFLEDGRVVNELAQSDPIAYLKLLSGISGNEEELLNNELAKTNIWDAGDNGDFINDNRLIIRINSIIHFFSFGNVYVHCLLFSFLAYIGLILIYLAFKNFIQNKKIFLFTLFVLPTIGFWGSGLTKEAIMIFSIGLFFWSLVKITTRQVRWSTLLILFIAIVLCLINKPYVGLVLLSISMVIILGMRFKWKKNVLIFYSGAILIGSILLSYAPEKINLIEKISYKQKDVSNLARGGVFFTTDSSFCSFDYSFLEHFEPLPSQKIRVTETTEGEYKLFGKTEFKPFSIYPSDKLYDVYLIKAPSTSYFETTPIANNGINLIKTIPECLVNTIIRPFPTDNGSPLKWLVFSQNMMFILFGILVFFYRKKPTSNEIYILYVLATSALIILLTIGWTTPIFGAIVRYKVPVDLFFVISLFMLYTPKKKLQ